MLVNGFSRLWDNEDCGEAIKAIAKRMIEKGGLNKSSPKFHQHAAMLVNGFSRFWEDTNCRNALQHTFEQTMMLSDSAFAEFDVSHLAQFLKALDRCNLLDAIDSLAPRVLVCIQARIESDQLRSDDLETLGSLCSGMLPLIGTKALRQHRQASLKLLLQLQPVIVRKLDRYLAAPSAAGPRPNDGEMYATRFPALSIYQILKTYHLANRQWTKNNVGIRTTEARRARQDLDGWLKHLYQRTASLIQEDLSSTSWNLIAQLEAEDPTTILDDFLAHHVEQVSSRHPAAVFDWSAVFDQFQHPPAPPSGDAGLINVPLCDLRGHALPRDVALDGDGRRYSIFARLTQQQLPILQVQLPGQLSAYMLGRTLTYQGKPYRLDLFGGSSMKGEGVKLSEIFAEPNQPQQETARNRYGRLFALPVADTLPGTPFERLVAKMFPNKESFYYFQRLMLASPPGIAGIGPQDHVLEGRFRIALLPDRADGVKHAFRLTDSLGRPIALRPHDGCGFIKRSLAQKMPVYAKAQQAEPYGSKEPANLPPQALQHYPRDERVAQEAKRQLQQRLKALPSGEKPKGEKLFRLLTTGGAVGDIAIAVPSADDKVHLPSAKSKAFEAHPDSGLLLGRSPYAKPNLRPIPSERVRTAAQGDATAQFLDHCSVMQTTFVGQKQTAAQPGAKKELTDCTLFGAKGLLIVVDDELWPQEFNDCDLVMSAEDVKVQSDWLHDKQRVNQDPRLEATGVLMATEFYGPGSPVAVPPPEQKMLVGDFDGDAAWIGAGYPELSRHVTQCDAQEQAKKTASFKPPKSHTPALDDTGHYRFGRAAQIMATRGQVMQDFTGLQTAFLAQPEPMRRQVARQAVARVYVGLAPGVKHQIRTLLHEQEEEGAFETAAQKLMADQQRANLMDPAVAQAAEGLIADVQRWRVEKQGKGPARAPEPVGQELDELFPGLREQLDKQTHPGARIELWLKHIPTRILEPDPPGYIHDDVLQTMLNLLSLGIQVGTDAYKSDTGAYSFSRGAKQVKRLFQAGGIHLSVPYNKSLARKLKAGTFDAEQALTALQDNPTLAGQVMREAVQTLRDAHMLDDAMPEAGPGSSSAPVLPAPSGTPLKALPAAPPPSHLKTTSVIELEKHINPKTDRNLASSSSSRGMPFRASLAASGSMTVIELRQRTQSLAETKQTGNRSKASSSNEDWSEVLRKGRRRR